MSKNSSNIYGFESSFSYFRDQISVFEGGLDAGSARSRLEQDAEERMVTDEARMVRGIMQTQNRSQSETRAVSTASNSDGVFVTPDYLVSEGDYFHSYPSSAIGQVMNVDDPGYGLESNIPTLTSITATSQQTAENSGVSDSSSGGAYATGPIVTLAGEVPVSLQLFDRSGPAPYTIDRIIQIALHAALVAEVDAYLLAQMQAAGGTTNGAGSYTAENFWQDVANTQSQITTGAGVKLPADFAWTQPQLAQWLLSESDTVGRPLLTPVPQQAPSAVKLTTVGGAAPGYTGTTLLGSHFFSDGNLADVADTNPVQSPIVFANGGEVFLTQSEPCIRIVSEGVTDDGQRAPSLTVLIQYFSYVGVVVRHGTALITLEADYLLAAPSFA
jgi:hypothetical protein